VMRQFHLRPNPNFSRPFNLIRLVQSLYKKYPASSFRQITFICCASRPNRISISYE
jgi:hypothetical protein